MRDGSHQELMLLHAVRLLGFGSAPAIAERARIDVDEAERLLSEAATTGWVQRFEFADLRGWSLTDDGKSENERLLAAEREDTGSVGVAADVYREFLPLNAAMLQAITDWQLRPCEGDRLAPNDHSDPLWDRRVLGEIADLGTSLFPLTARLSAVLSRFDGYAARYAFALEQIDDGKLDWVDKTDVDSCHRVWFEFHEDLLATLGLERGHNV